MTREGNIWQSGLIKPNSKTPLERTLPLMTTRLRYFHISTSDDADQSPRKPCAMLFLAVSESCPSSAGIEFRAPRHTRTARVQVVF